MDRLEKEEPQNEQQENEKAPYDDPFDETSSSWGQWGQSVYEECELFFNDKGSIINAFHLPTIDLSKQLLKDLNLFPIWGNVLSDKFNFGRNPASSAPVESEINKLKNNFMKQYTGQIRVDKFVSDHIAYIEGKSLLITADIDKNTTSEDDFMLCKVCNNNILPRHLSTCSICDDFIHKTDCSINYNQKRVCSNCLNEDKFAKKQIASMEIENWRGKGHAVPKKVKNIKSSDIDLQEDLCCDENDVDNQECLACKNGDLPSDAHKCIGCKKNVYTAFEGCSSSVGAQEGYGEKRICRQCLLVRKKSHSNIIVKNNKLQGNQMNNKQKKSYRLPAKYLGERAADVADSLAWENNKALPMIKNGNHPESAQVK